MTGTPNLVIVSDFVDYYDKAAQAVVNENSVLYNRVFANVPGKIEELRFMSNLGSKVVRVEPINRISPTISNVVVYTNTKAHRGNGKTVMSLSEASLMYPNKLGTEYFLKSQCITYKILVIGKRRFKCVLRNSDYLIENELLILEELQSGYNYRIPLPIYSIDYVQSNIGEMIVCDFNTVQRLDYLGVERLMSAEEVINEIYQALLFFNKAI